MLYRKYNFNKKILLIYILFNLIVNVFSSERRGQDLILTDSWIYRALLSIEVEMGRCTFGDQAPITINELKTYLDEIDYDKLSEPGKNQYDRISRYIKEKNFAFDVGILSVGVDPSINPEFYFKSCEETPWINDYTKRQALFALPVNFSIGDYLSAYMGFKGMQMYEKRMSSYNYCNEIFSPQAFDGMLTHETYLSTGYLFNNGVGINLRFGTGTQSIGNTLMPSSIISEYLTDAPSVNLRVYSPVFNYDFNITQLTQSALFYSHRIDFRFFKCLEVSFMEGVLPYSTFDLRYIDPFGIFHSYGIFNETSEMNSFFGAKIAYTPCKYLRIYGVYAQNEHQMANESRDTPEGMGGQLGLDLYIPIKSGYFHTGLESYYASTYMFIKKSPNVSFAKVFSELTSSNTSLYEWMGNPLGPDSLAFQLNVGYEVPNLFGVELVYNLACKGMFSGSKIFNDAEWKRDLSYNSDKWVYPTDTNDYSNGTNYISPHVTSGKEIEYQNIIYVQGTWYPTEWLTLVLTPGYSFIINYNNEPGCIKTGFEISLSARIQFARMMSTISNPDFLF